MANKPLLNPLPADLPENWQINQIVAPTGAEVGLAEQYGYNYLMAQLNAAQQAINNINEAFPGLAGLVDGVLPVSQGGTGNNRGYVRVGQKPNTHIGSRSTIEGFLNEVSGDNAHAEGLHNLASGNCTHVEGLATTSNGENSHAEGGDTIAEAWNSHAEGFDTTAAGECSHTEGYGTIASNFASHVGGKFNKLMTTGGSSSNKVGDVFVIGNGIGENTNRSNAFRVTYAGAVYGLSAFNASGADYAEYFEWQDANPEAEDRVGFFVTLQGDKICLAQAGDYLLGIVSANPCIIGNADEDWLGRWEHDDFGRFIQIDVETPVTELRHKEVPLLDENGEPTGEVSFEIEEVPTGEVIHGWDYKQNPDYDSSQQYIERKDRPEWAAVGMLGVLAVRDDGSCQVNGFCQCADGGIATVAEKYIPGQTYRVIARVTENIVKVVFR